MISLLKDASTIVEEYCLEVVCLVFNDVEVDDRQEINFQLNNKIH